MSIILTGNLQYHGTLPLDSRSFFETKADMLALGKENISNGQITFCQEDKKYYKFIRQNPNEPETGRWTELLPPPM